MTLLYIAPLYFIAWLCARLCLKDAVLQNKTQTPAKYWQIDGLRFFLAFSVFLHHAFIMQNYVPTAVWALTGDKVITFLGHGGVSLFFIITAFLFWDKALKKPNDFDAVDFLMGRIRRLAPVYLLVAVCFLILSLANSPYPGWALLGDVLRLASLGYFGTVNVGNLNLSPVYIGPFWTLYYEWRFYFILPLLYIALRHNKGWNIAALIAVGILILSLLADKGISKDWPYISLFACGILAATFHNSKYFAQIRLSQVVWQCIFVASIVLNIWSDTEYYGAAHPIFFLVTFLSVLKLTRESLLGKILDSQLTLLLGNASYSTYIIHGFIISILATLNYHFAGNFGNLVFIPFCVMSAIAVSLLSVVVYKYIELPYAFRKPALQGATPK